MEFSSILIIQPYGPIISLFTAVINQYLKKNFQIIFSLSHKSVVVLKHSHANNYSRTPFKVGIPKGEAEEHSGYKLVKKCHLFSLFFFLIFTPLIFYSFFEPPKRTAQKKVLNSNMLHTGAKEHNIRKNKAKKKRGRQVPTNRRRCPRGRGGGGCCLHVSVKAGRCSAACGNPWTLVRGGPPLGRHRRANAPAPPLATLNSLLYSYGIFLKPITLLSDQIGYIAEGKQHRVQTKALLCVCVNHAHIHTQNLSFLSFFWPFFHPLAPFFALATCVYIWFCKCEP